MKHSNGAHSNSNKPRTNYLPVVSGNRQLIDRIGQVNRYIDSTTSEEAPLGATNQDLKRPTREHQWSDTRHSSNNTLVKLPQSNRQYHDREDFESEGAREHQVEQFELSDDEAGIAEAAPDLSESNDDLEEVYLCNCCGITRELEPAMGYVPAFKSLFYLFNLLSFGFAFALLGFGLWYRIDPKVY